MAISPVNVQLVIQDTVISANLVPLSLKVPTGETVALQWKALGGATFPANAVTFKTPDPDQPTVTNVAGAKLIVSSTYTNAFDHNVIWPYTIQVQNGTTIVSIDPEVDNRPPGSGSGGDDDDDQGRGHNR